MRFLWKKDFDLYILVHPTQVNHFNKILEGYDWEKDMHITVHGTEDPYNIKFEPITADMIE